jgi:hypothetical protein
MPRGGRAAGRVNLESRERLDALRTFLSPDRPVTVRYCLYQLASRGLYPSTAKKHYRSIKELCLTARIRGVDHEWGLDDACFIDNKRVVEDGGIGYDNLADFQKPPSINRYYRNRWQDQPKHRTEIWCEKDTVAVLIRDVVGKWDAILRISMGGFGRAFLVQAANKLADVIRPITILYVGDWDPKGENIETAAREGNQKENNRHREGLRDILIAKHGWTPERWKEQVTWKRVAATENDFLAMDDKFKLPIKEARIDEETGQTTKGDALAPAWKERYGDLCLEVEALEVLEVGEVANRLDAAIQRYGVDLDAWRKSERKEAREKKSGRSVR